MACNLTLCRHSPEPVARWVHLDKFAGYRDPLSPSTSTTASRDPFVRSSYHIHEHVKPVGLRLWD
jgi:lipoate synthase